MRNQFNVFLLLSVLFFCFFPGQMRADDNNHIGGTNGSIHSGSVKRVPRSKSLITTDVEDGVLYIKQGCSFPYSEIHVIKNGMVVYTILVSMNSYGLVYTYPLGDCDSCDIVILYKGLVVYQTSVQ